MSQGYILMHVIMYRFTKTTVYCSITSLLHVWHHAVFACSFLNSFVGILYSMSGISTRRGIS